MNAGGGKSYAFLPQMDPLYQFLHVLKYFFLVPMTCCRAHTLGLEEEVRGGNVRRWGKVSQRGGVQEGGGRGERGGGQREGR